MEIKLRPHRWRRDRFGDHRGSVLPNEFEDFQRKVVVRSRRLEPGRLGGGVLPGQRCPSLYRIALAMTRYERLSGRKNLRWNSAAMQDKI